MVILAIQKLRDFPSFSNQFLGYDLLAQKQVRYAYVYPIVEALAGDAMITAIPEHSLFTVSTELHGRRYHFGTGRALFLPRHAQGVNANIMLLGGIAIAIHP